MTRYAVLCAAAVAIAAMAGGCGSPTIDAWADRGLTGVDHAKANTRELAREVRDRLDVEAAGDVDAAFDTILDAAQGRLIDPNSGQPVAIDARFLADEKVGLLMAMGHRRNERQTLDAAVETSLANLDEIATALEQIKRLRRSLGKTDELAAQVAELTAAVKALLAQRRQD